MIIIANIYIKYHKYCQIKGMLMGLDFPGSRKNFPFPGKKFPDRENFGKLQNPYQACLCNSNRRRQP